MEKFNQEILNRLENYISKKVTDEHEVQEIFQEVLIAATTSLPLFRGNSSFFTWLCGIANHEISDFYRKKKIKTILFSHLPWLENWASEALGPEQLFLKKEFETKTRKVLESLSEGYQEVLRLKYYRGLTIKEIAQRLNENTQTIESRLFRARQAFAKAYSLDTS